MNFLRKNSIRRKILDIEEELTQIAHSICNEKCFIYRIGGVAEIDTCVDFWVCVRTDKMAKFVEDNTKLKDSLKLLLEKYDYPSLYRDKVKIGIVSMETVKRVSNGNLWEHLV